MKAKLTSRKFWVFLIALVTALAAVMTGEITVPVFLDQVLKAGAVYLVVEGAIDFRRAVVE